MSSNHDAGPPGRKAFFEGFAWPVPRAFDAAVGAPRFEQGDVLYADPAGYADLEGRLPKRLMAIQVLHPPRSVRSAAQGGEADRRRSAWSSEVVIEWIDLASGRSDRRELTQGQLFTALWRGDEGWLDPDGPEPEPPSTARDLQQVLEAFGPLFDARGLPGGKRAGCRFLFVVDLASDASRVKAAAIEGALRALGELEMADLVPAETEIAEGERYHPALLVRGLFLPGRGEEEVRAALRTVLYGGTSGAAVEGEAAADRFSVTRHGLLQVI
ncbi:MAG: hypothetical protein JRF61_28120 [Deltaproteobacteria bacterium]|jgi:hypothetical protein|nr:hypothetical protein [Deltaproteobacteria bacterium]